MLKDISEIGIEICDFTGGTGAAYRTSVNNAGLPKERGIREVHETLMKKGMRRKGHITADGSVRHGLDIVRSVILGADSAAFGTALIMAQGCIMCHHCNHDNDAWKKDKQNNKKGCPTGLTTQSEEYRRADHLKMFKKLSAQKTPEERIEIASEYIKNYLRCVAEEIREICAKLGVKRLSDLRGRVYLLKQIETGDSRTDSLKLAPLLTDSSTPSEVTAGIVNETHDEVACLHAPNINERVTEQLETFFDDESQQEADLSFDVTNEDRAIGSRLSGQMYYVLKKYPNKKVNIRTHGYAGHGYGFAASSNMTLRNTGYANDSVGSMLNEAATIILTQPEEVKADSANASGNIICGKSCLYGSTGGEFYGEGCSDDRFAVRNSGARAVVEGTGKFACEYMTGGIVTILGPIGEQLGSGMSGGEVFLYQEQDDLPKRLNDDVLPITLTHESEALLQTQITNDLKATGSAKAAFILENWETEKHKFIHVLPKKEAEKRAKEILQEAAPA
jgi:glutamate synthase domain-containing protein 3